MSINENGLRVTSTDGVLHITLSRPEARNAIDSLMVHEMEKTFDLLWSDEIKSCLISGDGTSFCAGGDLKERRRLTIEETRTLRRALVAMFVKLAKSPVPVVIAVNGTALGGGFELVLCGDFIVADESARFGLPEVDLGIIPGGGGTQHLVRVAGLSIAREVILLGRVLSAPEAKAFGLVHQVVPNSELAEFSKNLASLLGSKPSLAIRQAKAAINSAWGYDIGVALAHEAELYDPCLNSSERDEALSQFNQHKLS